MPLPADLIDLNYMQLRFKQCFIVFFLQKIAQFSFTTEQIDDKRAAPVHKPNRNQ